MHKIDARTLGVSPRLKYPASANPRQFPDIVESSAVNRLTFNDPGRRSQGEMDVDPRVHSQPLADLGLRMSEVVHQQM